VADEVKRESVDNKAEHTDWFPTRLTKLKLVLPESAAICWIGIC
jgi:hypothetical protein